MTINLFGHPFTFRAEEGSGHAQKVADYLIEEVNRVEAQVPSKGPGMSDLAILLSAALNIASENFELKSKHSDLISDLSQKTWQLLQKLDVRD